MQNDWDGFRNELDNESLGSYDNYANNNIASYESANSEDFDDDDWSNYPDGFEDNGWLNYSTETVENSLISNQKYKKKNKKQGCLTAIIVFFAIIFTLLAMWGAFYAVIRYIDYRQDAQEKATYEVLPFPVVTLDDEDLAGNFYYNLLETDEKRTVYKEIAQGLKDKDDSILLHFNDEQLAYAIFIYVTNDYPEIFWGGEEVMIEKRGENYPYLLLRLKFANDTETIEKREEEVEMAATEILSGISPDASNYDKALYVYETVVKTVDYERGVPDSQNMYSAIVNKVSVCAGYAKMTQYLLKRLGIQCIYVTGISAGEAHAWNIVKVDDKYYHMDTTWGDPVFASTEGGESAIPEGYVNYDYFCVNDEQISRNHVVDISYPFPACTSLEANFYVVNGMYFEEYDREIILNMMNNRVTSKKNPTVVKFPTTEIYEAHREEIINDLVQKAANTLMNFYGMHEVNYIYFEDSEACETVVYWDYGN